MQFKGIRRLATILALLLLAAGYVHAGEKDFSIVVLPDPQHYASKYHDVGMAQTEWICEQARQAPDQVRRQRGRQRRSRLKDARVQNLVSFMDKLNGVVPYGVACGNHDLMDGKKGSYTSHKFVDYYGPHQFKKYPWYGGASPSGFSSYQTFSGGGMQVPRHGSHRCRPQRGNRSGPRRSWPSIPICPSS